MGYVPTSSRKTVAKKADLTTTSGLLDYSRAVGLGKQAEDIVEPKLSFLQRLGRGLNAFETGNALYQQMYDNKSFGSTYLSDIKSGLQSAVSGRDTSTEPKKTFKDIMAQEWAMNDRAGKVDAVDILGLVADIVGDPTTWFGGAIGKTAGKGIAKGSKAGLTVSKKIPKVGKTIKSTEDVVTGLFEPFAKIKKLPNGPEYVTNFTKFVKGTRSEQDDLLENISKFYKTTKKTTDNAGAKIGQAIETGTRTGDNLLDEALDFLKQGQEAITKQEVDRGILKSQLPDYMHHMLTPESADFVANGGRIGNFINRLKVTKDYAKTRKYLGAVKEINNEFKSKFGVDYNLFEPDAFKAFAKRGIDGIKDIRTHDFLTRAGEQFGIKEGTDEFVNLSAKGFIDDAGVKWADVSKDIPELAGVKLPEPIMKHISEVKKVMTQDEATNSFLKFHDKVLNFWKGSVTGYFPSFHTRNAIGGMFNNWIAGVKNPMVYKNADDILRGKDGILKLKNGTEVSYQAIRGMLKDNGVIGQTGILDVAEYLSKEIGESGFKKVTKAPQQVMGVIEDRLRAPLFIDGLRKGLSPEEAAKQVIKFHFDYMPEGFTAFEKTFMKRVIPFYTWTRHNVPLQIEQMVMQPNKYSGIMKAHRTFGVQPNTEEESVLPTWLKDRLAIKTEGGYWSGIGLPLEEATEKLADPLRGFGISMSPFIKTPMEKLTGYNIFKGKRIEDDRYGESYKNAPKPIKDFLELKKSAPSKDGTVYYTVNPNRRYLLETLGSRGWNTFLKLNNAIAEKDKADGMKLITTITKYDYSMEELRSWTDKGIQKELERMLVEQGEAYQFDITAPVNR